MLHVNLKSAPFIKINFRAFLIVAVAVLVAILLSYTILLNLILGIILSCVFFATIVCALIVILVRYRNYALYIFTVSLALLFALITFTVSTLTLYKWNGNSGFYSAVGRVESIEVYDGYDYVTISSLSFDGKDVSGNATIKITDTPDNLTVGDKLRFSTYLTANSIVSNGKVNGYIYKLNIKYSGKISGGKLTVIDGEPNAIESFLISVKSVLVKNMGSQGNLAYAMLFGDKSGLDPYVKYTFRTAGLGHIMAVSGLHISFTVALITFILKRFSKKVTVPITIGVLLIYTVLADFSPSVVRAVIMCIVGLTTLFSGMRKDALSSLCFAFCIILIVQPLYLFEAGFLMSFGALFGIIMFTRSISSAIDKIKVPNCLKGARNKVGSAIGVSTGAQIGIIPSCAYFYNSVQPYSIIMNIFLIPVIMFTFISTILCLFVSWIPYISKVLLVPKYLLVFIENIAEYVAFLPYARVIVYTTVAVFLCFPLLFIASEFTFIKRFKPIVSVLCLGCCAILCCVSMIPSTYSNSIIALNTSYSTDSIYNSGSKTYLIGDLSSGSDNYSSLCEDYYVTRIDAIYAFNCDENVADNIISISQDFKVTNVYLTSVSKEAAVLLKNSNIPYIVVDMLFNKDGFTLVYDLNGVCGYKHNTNAMFLSYKSNANGVNLNASKIVRSFTKVNAIVNLNNDKISGSGYAFDYNKQAYIN